MKRTRLVSLLLTVGLALTGCTGRETPQYDALEGEYEPGQIYYETASTSYALDDPELTNYLVSGKFYILHDGRLYPLYNNLLKRTTSGEWDALTGGSSSFDRFIIPNVNNIQEIPTLFEGDSLYYYQASGIFDYFVAERYRDLTWSVGMMNLKSTTVGRVYLSITGADTDTAAFASELGDMVNVTGGDGNLFLYKLGGIQMTDDYLTPHGKIVSGLERGAEYDMEVYNGTNYYYYNAKVNYDFLQGFESYALWDYIPLRDCLYEVVIPEYLKTGFYEMQGTGLFRLVRGTYYDDNTDYNERLLYGYYEHEDGEEYDEESENFKMPGIYSDHEKLNGFKAYDSTCFGYVEEDEEEVEDEELQILKDQFAQATITKTELYLPDGTDCIIELDSSEGTGSVYLLTDSGRKITLPYSRTTKTYAGSLRGTGEKATLVVQGLYDSYVINLTGAETYKYQDALPDTTQDTSVETSVETSAETEGTVPEETTETPAEVPAE